MAKATKDKEAKELSIADYEAMLAALETKRRETIERGAKLPQIRRDTAYAAHVENDPDAQRELDRVAAELVKHKSELDSISDAIAQTKDRLAIARDEAALKIRRADAKEAIKVLARFSQAGADLDQALTAVVDRAAEMMTLLHELHRTSGAQYPSHDQVDALGYAALMTAIQRTPWGRSFRPIAPGQRRQFGPLFDGWCTVVSNRLCPLLDGREAA